MPIKQSICFLFLFAVCGCASSPNPNGYPTHPQWSEVEIDLTGPEVTETDSINPFTDFRVDFTFTQGERSITIPGFFAADGQAAETSAGAGNVWRVRFRPPTQGIWTYSGELRSGSGVVYAPTTGKVVAGINSGIFVTKPLDGEKGRLLVGRHPRYLQWAQDSTYFLKAGADSPENFLAYAGFDGTYRYEAAARDGESKTSQDFLHRYEVHEKDWKPGDADWQNGKGKGMIGALNYIAERGINSFYFLAMNINGDGKDVWPYLNHEDRLRFDVSKLAQWEKVFDHADDQLGMMLHFVLGETENETLLDGGDLGPERKLYLRELIARFGHHRAVNWNLGEENGPNEWSENPLTTEQQKNIAAWLEDNDPYRNYVSVHTHPNRKQRREVFGKLVGARGLDGLSVQIDQPVHGHEETRYWRDTTDQVGSSWMVTIDEIGPWWRGLDPDDRADMNNQDSVRAHVLWANLMAGGAGAEWYFGAFQEQNDLTTEDWTKYDQAWRWSGHAIQFFQDHLPFYEMEPMDGIVNPGTYCLGKEGEIYAVYVPFNQQLRIDLRDQEATFDFSWFDAKNGGAMISSGLEARGGNQTVFDLPEKGVDWVAVFQRR
ncbi:DUF5060 domain-containing protein [Lewinellaceae bacterium SD302]|nr:DUF5060 domain-containing protein [Lewinellaceae bacterium SD302]